MPVEPVSRTEILRYFKDLLDGMVVNEETITAINYYIDPDLLERDRATPIIQIVPSVEQIEFSLNHFMVTRTMAIDFLGVLDGKEDVFLRAEDLLAAIIAKLADPDRLYPCRWGISRLNAVIEASPDVDYRAHIHLVVNVEYLQPT